MSTTDDITATPELGPPDDSGDDAAGRRSPRFARPMMGPLALVVIVAFFGILYPDTFLTRTNLVTNVLEVVALLSSWPPGRPS